MWRVDQVFLARSGMRTEVISSLVNDHGGLRNLSVVAPTEDPREAVRHAARFVAGKGNVSSARNARVRWAREQAATEQDSLVRDLALEWAWDPVSGANGYDVLLSRSSLAGPFETVRSQVAVPTGKQRYSHPLKDAQPGDRVYGAVATLTNSSQDRSSYSNGGAAVFLQNQVVASPADGQTVSDGRPILSWPALSGADGYLYFLCDKTCSNADAKDLWTNPTSSTGDISTTPSLSVAYPSGRAALPKGTYSWWVAGVKFNAQKQAIAFSYSAVRTLVVP